MAGPDLTPVYEAMRKYRASGDDAAVAKLADYLTSLQKPSLDLQQMQADDRAHKAMQAQIDNDALSRSAQEAQQPQGVAENMGKWLLGNPEATPLQRIRASGPVRAAVGAASVPIAAVQASANLTPAGSFVNDALSTGEDMKRAGGVNGTDWTELAGQVASPYGFALGKALGPAVTTAGRMWQGGLMGGAFGAGTPITNADKNGYFPQLAANTGMGVVGGAVLPAAWEAAKKGGAIVRNVVQPHLGEWGANQAAGRLMNDVSGSQKGAVINALEANKQFVPGYQPTAGEVASPAGSAGFAGLQEIVRTKGDPVTTSRYLANDMAQNNARAAAIRSFAGDKGSLENLIAERNAITAPRRANALANANLAGVKGPELEQRLAQQRQAMVQAMQNEGQLKTLAAQQENLAHGGNAQRTGEQLLSGETGNLSSSAYPVPGQPRIPGRYTENIQQVEPALAGAEEASQHAANRRAQAGLTGYQLDSLAAHGQTPLKADSVLGSINGIQNSGNYEHRILVDKVLDSVKARLGDLADQNGTIRAERLYGLRKDIGNYIDEAAGSLRSDKKLSMGLERQVQGMIDDAIEGAGGSGWKNYLKTYAEKSIPINQQQIGQELLSRLQPALAGQPNQRGVMFANALKDSANTVQRAGVPRFQNVEDALTPQNMAQVNAVKSDLSRAADYARLGGAEGTAAAANAIKVELPKIPTPGILNTKITLARSILNHFTGHATARSLAQAAEIMRDPVMSAQVMRSATPFERQAMVDLLMKGQAPIGAASANYTRNGQQQ